MPARHLRICEHQVARCMRADHHRARTERDGGAPLAQDLKSVRAGRRATACRTRREPGLDHRPPIESHMPSLTRAAMRSVLSDMNDTVRGMRWCGLLLAAACAADPSLAISVHHPEGYRVAQTLVTVYAGNDVRCDQIQYGDLAAAELAAIAIDEVEVGSGESLELSRLGGKSLVARGYDAQHRFVTAGCKDVGEIAGSAKVSI